jgi:hypothetical protein
MEVPTADEEHEQIAGLPAAYADDIYHDLGSFLLSVDGATFDADMLNLEDLATPEGEKTEVCRHPNKDKKRRCPYYRRRVDCNSIFELTGNTYRES